MPVGYFHVVFTLPDDIAAIAYQNKEVVLGLLFRITAETLRTIADDSKHLGAEIGFFAVKWFLPHRGNRYRNEKLTQCRRLLGMHSAKIALEPSPPAKDYRERYEELTGRSLQVCPHCRKGNMTVVAILPKSINRLATRINSS